MISFANPAWLYGLFGLLIPVGIHLLSRKEGKTIYIGSIRHLTDSDTAQFSSIHLNEILLLILRIILITIVVLILAGFNINTENKDKQQWLVIEKGVEKNERYNSIVDSLDKKGFEIRWLAEGFPMLADSGSRSNPENYFRLLQQIPPTVDTAIVLAFGYAAKFKGERIPLPSKVHWLTVDSEKAEIAIEAFKGEDSVSVRIMNSTPTGTDLNYSTLTISQFNVIDKIDSLQTQNPDTIVISIYATPVFAYDSKIIQASLLAISKVTRNKIEITNASEASKIDQKSDFIFWLSDKPWQSKNKIVIGYTSCENKNLPLITTPAHTSRLCGTGDFTWLITQRLNEEIALKENFTYSLSKIVLPKNLNPNVLESDLRTLPLSAAFSESNTPEVSLQDPASHAGAEPLLALLLFVVLVTERFIAYKRNQ